MFFEWQRRRHEQQSYGAVKRDRDLRHWPASAPLARFCPWWWVLCSTFKKKNKKIDTERFCLHVLSMILWLFSVRPDAWNKNQIIQEFAGQLSQTRLGDRAGNSLFQGPMGAGTEYMNKCSRKPSSVIAAARFSHLRRISLKMKNNLNTLLVMVQKRQARQDRTLVSAPLAMGLHLAPLNCLS